MILSQITFEQTDEGMFRLTRVARKTFDDPNEEPTVMIEEFDNATQAVISFAAMLRFIGTGFFRSIGIPDSIMDSFEKRARV